MTTLEQAVLDSLPRLFTLLDRAPLAPTRGSADRGWWHYRVDKDYPSATFAQAAWPLALLASRPELLAGRIDPALRARAAELALAAMTWWVAIQHEDGSFDEWFLHERSHVATAFTAAGIAEAALALGERFQGAPASAPIRRALARAAAWLGRNHDFAVANHAAGAVAALTAIDALLPGSARAAAEVELEGLLARQDPEGFFPEYGGADPGYSSVTHAWLACAQERLRLPALDQALERLERFLLPLVHPDGSFGGEHGRRATRYAWLAGLARRAGASPAADATLRALATGLERGTLPAPLAFDDRYFVFFALPDAVATLAALSERPSTPIDAVPSAAPTSPPELHLPRAGLHVIRRGRLHLVQGDAVGGVVKLWLVAGGVPLLYDDSGYVARLADGRQLTSWGWEPPGGAGSAATPPRPLREWSRASPIARHAIGFRLFNRTLGRLPAASAWVSRRAKARHVGGGTAHPITLARDIQVTDRGLEIRDRFTLADSAPPPAELRRVAAFAPVHVPSAPLWLPAFEPLLPALGADLAPALARGRALEVLTRVELDQRLVRLLVRAASQEIERVEATIEEP